MAPVKYSNTQVYRWHRTYTSGKSVRKVGAQYRVHWMTVLNAFRRLGLPTREPGRKEQS